MSYQTIRITSNKSRFVNFPRYSTVCKYVILYVWLTKIKDLVYNKCISDLFEIEICGMRKCIIAVAVFKCKIPP